jgi:hypothetical protein
MTLLDNRVDISRYAHSGDLASLEGVGGVSIIERRDPKEDIANGFDCIAWAFKDSPIMRSQWVLYRMHGALPACFLTVGVPEDGDLVEYQTPKNGLLRPMHIGIFKGPSGKVESKWGDAGHVFLHDLWAVPVEYGDCVNFYRPVPPRANRKVSKLELV